MTLVSVWTEAIEALRFEPLARVEDGPVIRVTDEINGVKILARALPRPRLEGEAEGEPRQYAGDSLREVFGKIIAEVPTEVLDEAIDRSAEMTRRWHERQKQQGDVTFVLLAERRRRKERGDA